MYCKKRGYVLCRKCIEYDNLSNKPPNFKEEILDKEQTELFRKTKKRKPSIYNIFQKEWAKINKLKGEERRAKLKKDYQEYKQKMNPIIPSYQDLLKIVRKANLGDSKELREIYNDNKSKINLSKIEDELKYIISQKYKKEKLEALLDIIG